MGYSFGSFSALVPAQGSLALIVLWQVAYQHPSRQLIFTFPFLDFTAGPSEQTEDLVDCLSLCCCFGVRLERSQAAPLEVAWLTTSSWAISGLVPVGLPLPSQVPVHLGSEPQVHEPQVHEHQVPAYPVHLDLCLAQRAQVKTVLEGGEVS